MQNTEKNLERIKNYCSIHKNSKSCIKLKNLSMKTNFGHLKGHE